MKSFPRFLVMASLAFLTLAPAYAQAGGQTVVEEIVARVNDQIITQSDVKRSREQLQQELKQQFGDQAAVKMSEREKDVLRDLVDQALLVQRGKDAGLTAETELIKKLDEIRKSMNLESLEDVEKAAQSQGVSFEDFKNNLRNSIITQQVIGQEVGRRMSFTPAEVTEYYEAYKKELEQPEQVELAEIMVSIQSQPVAEGQTAPAPTKAEIAAAKAKAEALLDSIKKGAKFEDVAKASSNGPTADQGGVLGAFKRGSMSADLETKVFALKAGEMTDVIRTRQGFIILKVLQHQAAGIPSQKEVEGQIMEVLYYKKLQPALRTYLTKLREDAYIDIKQGYVDSGASPNQTKPVFTAEASDKKPAKKKKKMLLF